MAEALATRGDHVIAIDLAAGPRLRSLLDARPHISRHPGEITEWPHVVGLVKDQKPDKIVHCAAIVGVPASVGSPIGTFRVNIEGTITVLEAMRLFGVTRMINISSEEIYGPLRGRHHRRDASLPADQALRHFQVRGRAGLPRLCERPTVSNASTPAPAGSTDPISRGRACPRHLLDAAVAGKPLHLPGGGNYAVDQVHIADVVQGILLALDKDRHRFDAYHITTGRAVSFNEVVALIKERLPDADLSHGSGPLRFVDGTEAVKKGALSIERAKTELGYRPKWDMRRGLHDWIDLLLTGHG